MIRSWCPKGLRMISRLCVSLVLLVGMPAVSQVSPAAEGATGNNNPMSQPPMVSGQALPTEVGTAENSNYLAASVAFESAYNDNLFPYYGTQAISGMSYSIRPTLTFDQSMSRFHQTWNWSQTN